MIEIVHVTHTANGCTPTRFTAAHRAALAARGYSFVYDDERERVIARPLYFGAARVFAY